MKILTVEPEVVSRIAATTRIPETAAWRHRLWRLKWGVAAAAVLLAIVASAALAPWVVTHDPLAVNIRHRLAPPVWMEGGTSAHWLGTDQIGRDLLSRMVYGGRVSLVVGVAAVVISASIGVLLGLAGGYFAGRTDVMIMTLINIMLTFPFVLLALAVIAVLGPSLINMIIVLGVADWPLYARVIRAETLALREREFVLAGRALGMSHLRLIFRQIFPNLVSVIVVIATLQVARVIILESFLSFLGLGVQEPLTSWGVLIAEGAAPDGIGPLAPHLPRGLPRGHAVLLQLHRRRPARRARPEGAVM
jgi:ABC-type dipeptide/oligopeptide/nickel transport system permease subunit